MKNGNRTKQQQARHESEEKIVFVLLPRQLLSIAHTLELMSFSASIWRLRFEFPSDWLREETIKGKQKKGFSLRQLSNYENRFVHTVGRVEKRFQIRQRAISITQFSFFFFSRIGQLISLFWPSTRTLMVNWVFLNVSSYECKISSSHPWPPPHSLFVSVSALDMLFRSKWLQHATAAAATNMYRISYQISYALSLSYHCRTVT